MGKIGRWINQVDSAVEEAILTGIMIPFSPNDGRDGRCINGQAWNVGCSGNGPWGDWNALCMRYAGVYSHNERIAMLRGTYPQRDPVTRAVASLVAADYVGGAKAAVLLRNRILANQARRVLAAVRAPQQAMSPMAAQSAP